MSSPRDSATKSARSRRSGQKLTDHDHSEILDQHQLQQQPSGKGGKVDQQQQKQQESPAPAPAPTVDSLLIAYSPPNETIHELASLNLGSYQSHLYHHQHQVPPVSYAKVRPEPINERSIVDSVVGFFHDVVGGEGAHSRSQHPSLLGHHHQSNKRVGGSGNSSALLGQPAIAEIKEQIEWIHFENFVNLDAYLNQSACSSSLSLIHI